MTDELHPRTEALLERVARAADAEGRLPLPDVASWDIFPFEGDIRVRPLEAPVLPEPARHGEDAGSCRTCQAGTEDAVWADERWKLVPLGSPASIPIVLLFPLAHLDMADLDEAHAHDLGPLMLRVEAALVSLGGVGRVHVYKVGDGATHLHVWFIARPEGLLQLRGSSLSDWSDCLPPMPDDEWADVMRDVAAAMAAGGGTALV